MKFRNGPKILIVDLRRSCVEAACHTIKRNAEMPPAGYKLVYSSISQRGSSGRAVNLKLRLVHCDAGIDRLADSEVPNFFTDSEAVEL